MDRSRPPGISFDELVLLDATVKLPEDKPQGNVLFEYDFDVESSVEAENSTLRQDFFFKLVARDESGAALSDFDVSFHLLGVFSADEHAPNLDLEKFSQYQAPALMVPFARELLHSITMRSRWRDLLMPPINIVAYLRAKDAQKQKDDEP